MGNGTVTEESEILVLVTNYWPMIRYVLSMLLSVAGLVLSSQTLYSIFNLPRSNDNTEETIAALKGTARTILLRHLFFVVSLILIGLPFSAIPHGVVCLIVFWQHCSTNWNWNDDGVFWIILSIAAFSTIPIFFLFGISEVKKAAFQSD